MNAQTIISLFGGIRPLATALGHTNPTTVSAWYKTNKIPHWRYHEVILASEVYAPRKLTEADFTMPRKKRK